MMVNAMVEARDLDAKLEAETEDPTVGPVRCWVRGYTREGAWVMTKVTPVWDLNLQTIPARAVPEPAIVELLHAIQALEETFDPDADWPDGAIEALERLELAKAALALPS